MYQLRPSLVLKAVSSDPDVVPRSLSCGFPLRMRLPIVNGIYAAQSWLLVVPEVHEIVEDFVDFCHKSSVYRPAILHGWM